MLTALKQHWLEYLIEAAGLGLFMVSACCFATLLEYPHSPARKAMPDPMQRRVWMGIAMGLTAIVIIYSPLGKRSGAHINPSVTLTFLRLGKIKACDAFFYVLAQFIGALLGVILMANILGHRLADPAVNYIVTIPSSKGIVVAFIGELLISFFLMLVILIVSNKRNLNRFTGVFAGTLVASYIIWEAPISGMSMNPARTLGSALSANIWTGVWVYFIAPLLGMLTAAEIYIRSKGLAHVYCAKLHHENNKPCIFNCRYHECK